MRKEVAIVGTVGLPASYGGFETLTDFLTKHLDNHFDFTVYCSSKNYPTKPAKHNGVQLYYIPLNANGAQSILYDMWSMIHALRYADTILVLGVSGCTLLPILRLFGLKHCVVNIDGLEWKRAKWGSAAKWFLKFSEKIAVKFATTIVTDNKAIQDYVLDEYSKQSALIAYGGDQARKVRVVESDNLRYPFLVDPYAFTVCRIEPENNVHLILEAASQSVSPPIVVVGNWDSSEYGRDLRSRYAQHAQVLLLDPIYDQNNLDLLRSNCSIYLHGHSAGGTNPSLVEAMSLELPIFAYDVEYNRETTENKTLYFKSTEELVNLLETTDVETRKYLGQRMYDIASKRYRWDVIADQYDALL